MEYDIIKENFVFCEKILKTGAEQGFDTEISLPDYCSDIQRILKCMVTANVYSCQIVGDRVTAEGEAIVSVIYVGEKGKLECYRQTIPFSKYAEIRDATNNCNPEAKVKIEYVNCRAISQRRINVSGNIGLIFTVTQMKSLALPSSAKGGGIQTKGENLQIDMWVNSCNKIFEMGETVSLGENQPPVASIIKSEACAVVDTVKAVENKVLIKGEMQVFVIYCSDDEKGEIIRFRHSMPISQILQIDDIDDECINDVSVTVCAVNVSTDTDSSGINTLLDISVKAEANIKALKSTELNVVDDCYSTLYEVKSESQSVDFMNHIFTYKETKQIKATVDLAPVTVSEVCGGFCQKADGTVADKSGKLEGRGNAIIGLVYKDANGEYGYLERSVDFNFECQGKQTENRIITYPVFSAGEMSCNSLGEDKAEVKLNINIFMPIYEVSTKRVCVSIEPDEEKPKKRNNGVLTVYFCGSGENLWDIARKYNTTVEKIKEENELTQDIVSEKVMLMIPTV